MSSERSQLPAEKEFLTCPYDLLLADEKLRYRVEDFFNSLACALYTHNQLEAGTASRPLTPGLVYAYFARANSDRIRLKKRLARQEEFRPAAYEVAEIIEAWYKSAKNYITPEKLAHYRANPGPAPRSRRRNLIKR